MFWTTRKISTLAVFFTAVVLIGLEKQSLGQEEKQHFTLQPIRVLDAPHRRYAIGERLILNVDHNDLRMAGGSSGIRIRIFRGSVDELIHGGGFRTDDGCVVFVSRSYRATEANGGLRFDISFDLKWLRYADDEKLQEEAYLLVFEKAPASGEYLKLQQDDLQRYFQQAYPFTVSVPQFVNPKDASEVKTAQQAALNRVLKDITEKEKRAPCLRLATTFHENTQTAALEKSFC